jgi:hypothetical protein
MKLFANCFVAFTTFFREHPLAGRGILWNAAHTGLQRVILSSSRNTIAAPRGSRSDALVATTTVFCYHTRASG